LPQSVAAHMKEFLDLMAATDEKFDTFGVKKDDAIARLRAAYLPT
jgi:hypothetical protein